MRQDQSLFCSPAPPLLPIVGSVFFLLPQAAPRDPLAPRFLRHIYGQGTSLKKKYRNFKE